MVANPWAGAPTGWSADNDDSFQTPRTSRLHGFPDEDHALGQQGLSTPEWRGGPAAPQTQVSRLPLDNDDLRALRKLLRVKGQQHAPAERETAAQSTALAARWWQGRSGAAALEGKPWIVPRQPQGLTISHGTIGHPHTCARACRYVWRKGGCRLAEGCPHCHKCHWQRGHRALLGGARPRAQTEGSEMEGGPAGEAAGAEEPFMSLPTQLWLNGTDTDDPACLPCGHAGDLFPGTAEADAPQPVTPGEGNDGCPSIGSIGHPFTCASACKYHGKPKGCKDGSLCTRCHLCRWHRALLPKQRF